MMNRGGGICRGMMLKNMVILCGNGADIQEIFSRFADGRNRVGMDASAGFCHLLTRVGI